MQTRFTSHDENNLDHPTESGNEVLPLERETRSSGTVSCDADGAWTRYYIPRDSSRPPPYAVVYRGQCSRTLAHRATGSMDGRRGDSTRRSPMHGGTSKERVRITRTDVHPNLFPRASQLERLVRKSTSTDPHAITITSHCAIQRATFRMPRVASRANLTQPQSRTKPPRARSAPLRQDSATYDALG